MERSVGKNIFRTNTETAALLNETTTFIRHLQVNTYALYNVLSSLKELVTVPYSLFDRLTSLSVPFPPTSNVSVKFQFWEQPA